MTDRWTGWRNRLWRALAGSGGETSNAILPGTAVAAGLAAMAPLALVLAALAPRWWPLAPAAGGVLLALALADGWLAGALREVRLLIPAEAEVGAAVPLTALADFTRPPRVAHAALALDDRLAPGGRTTLVMRQRHAGVTEGTAPITPTRRCEGRVTRLWLRWPGPLGLGWRHHSRAVDATLRVTPNLALIRSPAIQALVRNAELGLVNRRLRGEGTLFETMLAYQPGMDRRRIDWKVSARHAALHAREYEAERNNRIVFALDCGHGMCEPVAGEPRLDRAVSAALATAWAALKTGDQCALFGFDARVRLATPFASGVRGFARLRSAAAGLDYSPREPNFTLALAALAARLERRALIVVFSDFTDSTSAELMIESVSRLIKRHRVLFVTMEDEELAEAARAEPADASALATAVSAAALLNARALVLAQLRGLGVIVVEARYDAIGTRLIDTYLALRSREQVG